MKRILAISLLIASWVLAAHAQGGVGVLQCTFKGGVDLRVSRQPSSAVIARIPCGARVLLLDSRFGSPHVRTEDDKDGYITSLNLGQWWIAIDENFTPDPVQPQSRNVVQPPNTNGVFRRREPRPASQQHEERLNSPR